MSLLNLYLIIGLIIKLFKSISCMVLIIIDDKSALSYIIFYEGSVSNTFFFIIVFLSFVGFRFFDILKPYPINYVDKKMKSGFGVILDDLIAGFFTLIVLYVCIIFYGQIW